MYNLNPQRPSTSPAPNFMFADIKKAAAAMRGGGGGGVAAHQAAIQSRLRPIPASSQGVRPQGMLFGGLTIEGAKTGEEKLVTAVDRRESVSAKPSAPLDTGSTGKENQTARDTQRIKKLEAEIKKLQELVRKRTQERDDTTRRAEDFESLLDAANRKLTGREAALNEELRQRQEQIEQFRTACAALEAKLKRFEEEHLLMNQGQRSSIDRHAQELQNAHAQLERLRRELTEQIEVLKHENRQQRDVNLSLEKKVAAAAHDAAARETSFQKEAANLREQCAKHAAGEAELRSEMRSREQMLEDWKLKMDQCRQYIVKICQPQFSVVKDDSLTPVHPGSQEAGGFVLVPLTLMLEGYTLLPPDMKKRIADDYESAKKPAPRK
jgi:predicted  nucleic acid-binding Zn-ribbon protein